jgi:hypothetical protein
MQLAIGILLFVGAIVAFRFSLPKDGKPRAFVGTQLESPIVIAILIAGGLGLLMALRGVAA